MDKEENNNAGENGSEQEGNGEGDGNEGEEEQITANDPFDGFTAPADKEEEEDSDVDQDEIATIDKRIERQMGDVTEELRGIKEGQALSTLYSGDYGDVYKQFDKEIRKALADPRAKGFPPQIIADRVVPKRAFAKAGAQQARKADKKARVSRTGGRSSSKVTGESFDKLESAKDRQAMANKIKQGKVKIFDDGDPLDQ